MYILSIYHSTVIVSYFLKGNFEKLSNYHCVKWGDKQGRTGTAKHFKHLQKITRVTLRHCSFAVTSVGCNNIFFTSNKVVML